MGMCSFRILAAGAANGCRLCRPVVRSNSRPIGSARFCRPPTASTDRAVKVPIYAREKVGHVWLVDPLLQTLEVLRLDGPGYRLAGVWRGDLVVQCEPFEALSIRLVDLWSA